VSDRERGNESHAGIPEFITAVGTELAAQGFPRIPAFVIVALTVSESGRMTAADLRDEVGVSAAAISGAIRYLSALRFVRIVTGPGGRRHVYELGETPWYTASLDNVAMYRRIGGLVRESATAITGRPAARARAGELAEFFAFLERRMPALLAEWDEERRHL
jgi:hypothetical protein